MDVTELEFYIYRSLMIFSASVLESRCLHVIPQAVRTIKGVADVHLRHAQKLELQLVVPSIGKLNLEAVGSHCRHPSSVSPVFASSTLLLRCPLNRKLQSRANSPPVIYVSDNHRVIATTPSMDARLDRFANRMGSRSPLLVPISSMPINRRVASPTSPTSHITK